MLRPQRDFVAKNSTSGQVGCFKLRHQTWMWSEVFTGQLPRNESIRYVVRTKWNFCRLDFSVNIFELIRDMSKRQILKPTKQVNKKKQRNRAESGC